MTGPREGDVLENAATGLRLRVLHDVADPLVDPLVVEATYPPASAAPPEHFHPRQRERFEVLEGEIEVRVAGTGHRHVAGQQFDIPAGVRHAMWNPSATDALVRWHTQPARRTWELFTRLAALASQGETDASGRPALLQSAVLARAYRDELRLTRPGALVQALVVPVLAFLGRMRGLKG